MVGLRLDGVTKRFHAGRESIAAIDRVTLTVARGEIVALHGPSGSGKTTLLLLAAGLIPADEGSICFDGVDLTGLSADSAALYQRGTVGLIPQTADLFPGVPAVENAAIKLLADRVPLSEARRRVVPWLDRVGLGERLDHTPDQLSTGERMRVAIARALVNRPGLILADEPTASLDSRRGLEIAEMIASSGTESGAAVLLVTHDARVAEVADRVESLRDGELVAPGPPAPSRAALS